MQGIADNIFLLAFANRRNRHEAIPLVLPSRLSYVIAIKPFFGMVQV